MHYVDLYGADATETINRVGEMITRAQTEYIAQYLSGLVESGTDRETIATELARYCTELTALRKAALVRLHSLLERDREALH